MPRKESPLKKDGPAATQESPAPQASSAQSAPPEPTHAPDAFGPPFPSTGLLAALEYLTDIPAWFLATCEGDQPHVRPFSFVAEQGGKLWFCTARTKDVYRELEANPKFELSGWKPGRGWIVLRGRAGLADEARPDLRRAGYEHMAGLGESYDGADDPALTFFSVEDPVAWIADIDGSKQFLRLA